MKKNLFALAAFLMFTGVGLANTHEVKKEKKENSNNSITNNLEKKTKILQFVTKLAEPKGKLMNS